MRFIQTGSEKVPEGLIVNKYFENKLIKKNQNIIFAVTGSTGCLFENTIVAGQNRTLKDLYSSGNNFINTISITKPLNKSGGYYPKRSKSEIIDSGIKEVYEIELEDGRKVLATKDHKLFKKVGHKIVEEVISNLKVGDELRFFSINNINKLQKIKR